MVSVSPLDNGKTTPRNIRCYYHHSRCLLCKVIYVLELHLIVKLNNSLYYVVYDMTANQFSETQPIPAHTNSFINKKTISLYKYQPQSTESAANSGSDLSVTLLRDGNSALYPLLRNSTNAFVDPRWFDLVPVQSIGAYTESLTIPGSNHSKSRVTILAIALQVRIVI